jgi:hypothetical protein
VALDLGHRMAQIRLLVACADVAGAPPGVLHRAREGATG